MMTDNPNMTVEAEAKLESPLLIRSKLLWRAFKENWSIFSKSKIGMIGLYIVVIFAVAGFIVYPILANTAWKTTSLNAMVSYNPITGYDFLQNNPAPPSWAHLLGTDPLGRDVLAQLLYSTPREFMLGIVAALITVIIGTLIGTVAAYFGGALDTFFMRLADIVLLFPFIPFLIVISGMMQLHNRQQHLELLVAMASVWCIHNFALRSILFHRPRS